MVNEHTASNGPASPHSASSQQQTPLTLSDRVQSLRLNKDMPKAKRERSVWLPWTLCAVLALASAGLGAVALEKKSAEKTPPPAASSTTTTQGAETLASSGDVTHESQGYVVPAHQIQVSPKVSGMIVKLNIEEGRRVQKGDILAELETVEYQTDYDHAVGALESARQRLAELSRNHKKECDQARAELDEAEAQRLQLRADFQRSYALRGAALADRDYEQAESAYRAMEQRVRRLKLAVELLQTGPRLDKIAAAKAEVKEAEADVVKTKWRLDNCVIRAPISGTILTKFAEEGNIVNQLSFNLKGSLCDMADLADLEIVVDVQERDISRISAGQQCRVRSLAFPDKTYKAVVSRLMPIADRGKGSVKVRVKPTVPREEEGVYLKPDCSAIVSFLKTEQKTSGTLAKK
jgi:multidrug resistance efflux pump